MKNNRNIFPEMDNRNLVLSDSLNMELVIARICALLLGIPDANKSYSFGNTSKALTFNQKVYLLIDIGALPNKEKTKFLKFMEIRNQFMHNIGANSFTNCVDYIEGIENYLTKTYQISAEADREQSIRQRYLMLVSDIRKCVLDLLILTNERVEKRKGLI